MSTYTDSDDLVDTTSPSFKHGFEIHAALARLLCNGALDEVSGGVGGDLASAPDLAGGFDGVGVWSGGWGSVLAVDFLEWTGHCFGI